MKKGRGEAKGKFDFCNYFARKQGTLVQLFFKGCSSRTTIISTS